MLKEHYVLVENCLSTMADLETMSLKPNAAIVSIGAVKFYPCGSALPKLEPFYINVDLESCKEFGLHVDPGTVAWWEKQSQKAKDALKVNPVPLPVALEAFSKWMMGSQLKERSNGAVWANGSDFDNVILQNAYQATGLISPFKYTSHRCFRTMNNMFGCGVVTPANTLAHHALADAKWQALMLQNIMNDRIIPKS